MTGKWIDNGGSVWLTGETTDGCTECGSDAEPLYYCRDAARQGRTGLLLCRKHLAEQYGGKPYDEQ